MKEEVMVFYCPVHGPEMQVLCWRALSLEFRNRWNKYKVTYEKLQLGEAELAKYISDCKSNS